MSGRSGTPGFAVAAVIGTAALIIAPDSQNARSHTPPPVFDNGPRLIEVRYVNRPVSADSHGPEGTLLVRAVDRDGQIIGVGWTFERDGGGHADGGCGLGGNVNGREQRWRLPVRRLAPGEHRVSITLTSSSCDAAARLEERSFKSTIAVAGRRAAGAGTPPDAIMGVGPESRRMALGSFCWTSAHRAMCQLRVPRAGPILAVARAGRVRFEFGFRPSRLRLYVGEKTRRAVRLRARRVTAWTVPADVHGRVPLMIDARGTRGRVSYRARLRVR